RSGRNRRGRRPATTRTRWANRTGGSRTSRERRPSSPAPPSAGHRSAHGQRYSGNAPPRPPPVRRNPIHHGYAGREDTSPGADDPRLDLTDNSGIRLLTKGGSAPCCGPDLSRTASAGRLILLVQPPDLYDLDAERLEPGQKPVQGGLVLKRAVHDRLDRFDRGGEPVEVEQRLGRENTGDPDLVVGRWHRGS